MPLGVREEQEADGEEKGADKKDGEATDIRGAGVEGHGQVVKDPDRYNKQGEHDKGNNQGDQDANLLVREVVQVFACGFLPRFLSEIRKVHCDRRVQGGYRVRRSYFGSEEALQSAVSISLMLRKSDYLPQGSRAASRRSLGGVPPQSRARCARRFSLASQDPLCGR